MAASPADAFQRPEYAGASCDVRTPDNFRERSERGRPRPSALAKMEIRSTYRNDREVYSPPSHDRTHIASPATQLLETHRVVGALKVVAGSREARAMDGRRGANEVSPVPLRLNISVLSIEEEESKRAGL